MPLFRVDPKPPKKVNIRRWTPCMDREHNPPSMMVYEPGAYEYECPSCKHITKFIVGYNYKDHRSEY